jgi:hypothetical protein
MDCSLGERCSIGAAPAENAERLAMGNSNSFTPQERADGWLGENKQGKPLGRIGSSRDSSASARGWQCARQSSALVHGRGDWTPFRARALCPTRAVSKQCVAADLQGGVRRR